MTADPRLEPLDVDQATARLDEIVDLYVDVYADADDEFFGEDRYRRQLAGHLQAPAWDLVAASVDGEMVGYIYGFALPAGTRWWRGLLTDTPPGFTDEDGQRTVAISEILVRDAWRRRGIARALHHEFLARRAESRATLLVEPDNTSASRVRQLGLENGGPPPAELKGAPRYDVLVLRPVRGS